MLFGPSYLKKHNCAHFAQSRMPQIMETARQVLITSTAGQPLNQRGE